MKLESEQVSASLQALYPHCTKIKAPSIILRKTRFQKKLKLSMTKLVMIKLTLVNLNMV
jgi:hypothetical protein